MPVMPERHIRGRVASPGLAHGPVRVWTERYPRRVRLYDPATEASQLRQAMRSAVAQLESLAAGHPGNAAQMLQFQIALLLDDALAAPAYEAIARGNAADAAWSRVLDDEIAGYEGSGDDYFGARASDLRDLKWRVLRSLGDEAAAGEIEPGCVLFAEDLPPSAFLSLDWSRGGAIVLGAGSSASHLAMLARSRGVPMIVGTGTASLSEGEALVDADKGIVVLQPEAATRDAFLHRERAEREARWLAESAIQERAVTRDGIPIEVLLNVTDVRELEHLSPRVCDGVGLVRSEFLFGGSSLPDEEQQYQAYTRILRWAQGRPVTIRTLDAGGDKQIAGLSTGSESNPALGLRGVRLSLAYPEVLRVQLRALARAASHGALRIMVPMVTVPHELARVRAMLDEELAKLAARHIAAFRPPVGMMVEVPAAALTVDQFDADFFSIGSNDLVQYTTAAARDLGSVADLAQAVHPAVLELVSRVVSRCAAKGREVSVCGDAAAEPPVLRELLARGVRSVSVAPAAIATTKAAVREIDLLTSAQG